MTSFENFKRVISVLESNDFDYRIFGGYVCDGIRGQITREHKDIDIYLKSDQIYSFAKIFSLADYSFIQKDKMFYIEGLDLKIGIVVFTQENEYIIAHGNHTVVQIPLEIWKTANYLAINNEVKFLCSPNELLVFDGQYSKYEDDKKLISSLPYDKKLFEKIKILTS